MTELDVPARPVVASKPSARGKRPALGRASTTMVPVVPAAARAPDPAPSTRSRVETCLGELRSAMAAMTQRQEPAVFDPRPIIDAVQAGFEGASRQSAALCARVLSRTDQLNRIGPQDERSCPRTVADETRGSAAARSHTAPPQFAAAPDDHLPISLLALAVLVLCWSVLLWFKTSAPSV